MLTVSGPFSRITFEDFNLNSFEQIKAFLLKNGWVPKEYTDKGSPKLTEDSFEGLQSDIAKMIAERAVLLHRRRMLRGGDNDKGWLNLLRDDGRLTAGGIPQGTPTGRYRHSGVVNVPRVGSAYGEELRSLFIPKDGWVLVGCDAAALEARVEAHYCWKFRGGEAYAKELLEGDLHTKNAESMGCTRNVAKTLKYAISYGASPAKVAQTLGCSEKKGRQLFNAFWKSSVALADLREAVIKAWKARGYLVGLDGRKLFGRSEHSLVNLLFQSAGAIICKTAVLYLAKWIREEGIRANQVIMMHDEVQYECHPEDVDRLMELAVQSFVRAGEFYKLNVPMAGEAKAGANWAQTH